jgi:guanosine-3',5'-bis(diphosphate) 3'-pyrophosphohydrolase
VSENRKLFFDRLTPFHAPSTILDIQLAYTLAKFSHRAQVRKELDDTGQPVRYFEHVRRVALVLIDEAKIVMPEMIISSLLHDGPEDTRDLNPEMIEHCFGPDVVSIVKTLSKTPKENYLDRFYVSTDWRPYMIKACDRLDNLRSLPATTIEFRRKQIAETRDKYLPLFERMEDITPPIFLTKSILMRNLIINELFNQMNLLSLNLR